MRANLGPALGRRAMYQRGWRSGWRSYSRPRAPVAVVIFVHRWAVAIFVHRWIVVIFVLPLLFPTLSSCVRSPEPAPAELRTTAPPWDAPRDAISYIRAAGFEPQPLNLTDNQHVLTIKVSIDGRPVGIPAYVGIDRLRAVEAPVHTHDTTGSVWLEGRDTGSVTLGQFFTVWGVRFDRSCVGARCGSLHVTVDGTTVGSDPRIVRLATAREVDVDVNG
jgi:hypothetical protein